MAETPQAEAFTEAAKPEAPQQLERGQEARATEVAESSLHVGESYEAAAGRQAEETRAEGGREMTRGQQRLAALVHAGQTEGLTVT